MANEKVAASIKVSEIASEKEPAMHSISSPTSDNGPAFPFLKLPPELRNMIYALLLVDDVAGCISFKERPAYGWKFETNVYIRRMRKPPKPSLMKALFPVILRVNRRINCEASSVLYRQSFVFGELNSMERFLSGCGENAKLLRSLDIVAGVQPSIDFEIIKRACRALKNAENLECLGLGEAFLRGLHSAPDEAGKYLFKRLWPWLDAAQARLGTKEKVIDIVHFAAPVAGKTQGSVDSWYNTLQGQRGFREALLANWQETEDDEKLLSLMEYYMDYRCRVRRPRARKIRPASNFRWS